VTQNK